MSSMMSSRNRWPVGLSGLPRIQHQVPRVAAVVVDGVQILDMLVDQNPYDLEVAISSVGQACLVQGRSPY